MREAVKCVNRSTRPTAQFKISVWTRWLYFTKYITAAGSARPNRQRVNGAMPMVPGPPTASTGVGSCYRKRMGGQGACADTAGQPGSFTGRSNLL